MVLALEFLHSKGYIHRDIKPDNLLLDGDGYCYLIDFNVSIKAETSRRKAGTGKYMAPELVSDKEYDKGVDWWSFGVTLFEIYYNESPFENENEAVSKNINIPALSGSAEFKDLIAGILQKDPAKRFKCEQIKAHPFFKKINWADILEKRVKAPYVPDPEKAHCSPDHEFEEVFGGAKRKKEKLTEADQALFSSWDWEEIESTTQGQRTLQAAIRAGNINEVAELIKTTHVDQPIDARKNTYLHLAVRENRADIVRMLIEAKASVNATNSQLWTPLHEACALGNHRPIEELLAGGANVMAQTKEGTLPIHLAVMHSINEKKLSNIEKLTKNGALLNALTHAKETPLHFACSSLAETLSSVKYLVEQKADVNVFSKLGFTPLHRAVVRRKKEVVQYLLANGASKCNPKSGKSLKELTDGEADIAVILGYKKPKGDNEDKKEDD
eukprot:TRINITY_DN5130_c0_g1_i2.p1 TRINITY_DN5130_c0_g1~~TRINITY_DN5130_c0_g1_i2.p1  ORF type:complete len:442 (-),score=72.81 TRINITY_DN5130_c0_g1_i2:128-1453(-)